MTLYPSHFKDKSENFQRNAFGQCKLANETIHILFKEGNYNCLMKEEQAIKEMKKFGSKYLKPFEMLVK